MVRILTICKHCGDVEVTLDEISVRVWVGTEQGEYTLRCPHCDAATVWPASAETIDVLAASGAALENVVVGSRRPSSAESGRPSRPSVAPVDRRRRSSDRRRPHRPTT